MVKLVRYRADGSSRIGVLAGAGFASVLDVTEELVGREVEGILGDADSRDALGEHAQRAATETPTRLIPLSGVRLEAPVRPSKIVCVGYNLRGHVPDGVDPTADDPEFPDIFVKTPNTLAGPNDDFVSPPSALEIDYEGELGVVIGRSIRGANIDDARAAIGGYVIVNDITDRAWQRRQSQWALGKCFDGSAPLGPWVVTADEISDPLNLMLEVEHNGVVTARQSTSTMVFSPAYVVHYISQTMTLFPGDVIAMGSAQKLPEVLADPGPVRSGDTVTVRISGIGSLHTRFISLKEN